VFVQALIYDHFRVRVAPLPYNLTSLDVLQVHLTNTTLETHETPGAPGAATATADNFIDEFDSKYGSGQWEFVRKRIDNVLGEFFHMVHEKLRPPERQRHALFGVDILLDEGHQPLLLEVNKSPNCIGVCREKPSFFSDVFTACGITKRGQQANPLTLTSQEVNNRFRPLFSPPKK